MGSMACCVQRRGGPGEVLHGAELVAACTVGLTGASCDGDGWNAHAFSPLVHDHLQGVCSRVQEGMLAKCPACAGGSVARADQPRAPGALLSCCSQGRCLAFSLCPNLYSSGPKQQWHRPYAECAPWGGVEGPVSHPCPSQGYHLARLPHGPPQGQRDPGLSPPPLPADAAPRLDF